MLLTCCIGLLFRLDWEFSCAQAKTSPIKITTRYKQEILSATDGVIDEPERWAAASAAAAAHRGRLHGHPHRRQHGGPWWWRGTSERLRICTGIHVGTYHVIFCTFITFSIGTILPMTYS